MAVTVGELIVQLQTLEAAHGSDQIVVTDNEASVIAAEYNEDGSPAIVIVTD